MGMGDYAGEISASGCEGFIVLTEDDFGLSVLPEPGEEVCPRCGANDKVRGSTNRWLCKKCNRSWNRRF